MKAAFIGLGVMGYPMAGHWQQAGLSVCVFNRTAAKAAKWVDEFGGCSAATPEKAAAGTEVTALCVGNDDDVRAVALGPEGAIAGMRPGSVLVDHTTTSATVARELEVAAEAAGCSFVDAPVSGGQAGAEQGLLTIMCGGRPEAFEAARPAMEHYAKRVRLMGPTGYGQLTKMVNQICIAGLVQGLAEGLDFACRAGLDPLAAVEVISQGAAQSWQMDNRHKTMLADEYDHGFAVDWMRKDLAIALAEGRRNGARLEVTELVDRFYAEVQAMGGGRWDTSSLLRRLKSVPADAS